MERIFPKVVFTLFGVIPVRNSVITTWVMMAMVVGGVLFLRKRAPIVLEMLNSRVNHKDYMADTTNWAVEVAQQVGSPRFKLLYDIYHMQIMEGDVIRTIRDNQFRQTRSISASVASSARTPTARQMQQTKTDRTSVIPNRCGTILLWPLPMTTPSYCAVIARCVPDARRAPVPDNGEVPTIS